MGCPLVLCDPTPYVVHMKGLLYSHFNINISQKENIHLESGTVVHGLVSTLSIWIMEGLASSKYTFLAKYP